MHIDQLFAQIFLEYRRMSIIYSSSCAVKVIFALLHKTWIRALPVQVKLVKISAGLLLHPHASTTPKGEDLFSTSKFTYLGPK